VKAGEEFPGPHLFSSILGQGLQNWGEALMDEELDRRRLNQLKAELMNS
jgi:hypothetical protein